MLILLVCLAFVKMFRFLMLMDLQRTMYIIIAPRSNITIFYNCCNSIELPFDDNDHHSFINSTCYHINELNALNNKANYFGILRLNIASLKKHINSLSNVLSMMKFIFLVIGLTEHKIRSNSFINNISLPGHTFCYDETMKLRAPILVLVST